MCQTLEAQLESKGPSHSGHGLVPPFCAVLAGRVATGQRVMMCSVCGLLT